MAAAVSTSKVIEVGVIGVIDAAEVTATFDPIKYNH